MKTLFSDPELTVVRFEAMDVLTASGEDNGFGDNDDNEGDQFMP